MVHSRVKKKESKKEEGKKHDFPYLWVNFHFSETVLKSNSRPTSPCSPFFSFKLGITRKMQTEHGYKET